jgi:hypothetical protein
MSYAPGVGVDVTAVIHVGHQEVVDLSVRRADGGANLTIGGEIATITLDKVHLVRLWDQLSGVLADLEVLEAANERAAEVDSRAVELAAYLTDQARTAEQAGEHEQARELRGVARNLTVARKTLERALAVLGEATQAADEVAEDARRFLDAGVAEEQPASEEAGR